MTKRSLSHSTCGVTRSGFPFSLRVVSLAAVVVTFLQGSIASRAQTPVTPSSPAAITPLPSVPKATTTPDQASATPGLLTRKQADSGLLIGPGDLLNISVFNVPDMTGKFRVDEDGTFLFPLLGSVHAAGQSASHFAEALQEKLRDKNLLIDPQVTVQLSEFGTQGITVGGEIQKPGTFEAFGPKRLYEVLALAGGTSAQAGNTVSIFRRGEGDGHPYPLHDGSGMPTNNLMVYPGDMVIVQKAGIFYVMGDVQKPGGFLIDRPNISILQALSVAQGPTKTAQLGNARILRKTGTTYRDLPIDLRPLLKGMNSDLELLDGDVLYLPDSGLKTFYQNSTSGLVGTLAGAAIYALNR